MSQLSLFDATRSEAARRAGMTARRTGMAAAADAKEPVLSVARRLAVALACKRENREITADNVVLALVTLGYDMHCLGNSAGSLFTGGQWIWTGDYKKSTRTHAHRNLLRIWRLKEGETA